ncbi:double-strand-break repair protein rad21 like protein [Trypanosoma brucei equiperdum]|uniref:Double-strand-break repair protein rad21 like protein n=1 Tax=Trypanosoma brucei equiperdum TaxID=630700 RepID=A0A3L6L4Q7_9TRYP|nr:double-strand-break repair protein rad21 like protein [Trypanosoma brucei equiperdum]
MFYSTYVLTKDGPLAKIWLAAHWERRITRSDVRLMDLRKCVVDIVQPVVPIALRTSGELLVGVVRIYAVKVHGLKKDAENAILLIRVASPQANAGHFKKAAPGTGTAALLNGDAEAATFNWGGRRVGRTQGVVAIRAAGINGSHEEALEARFDEIADLLQGPVCALGGVNDHVRNGIDSTTMTGSVWYTWNSGSQGTEDLNGTQQDYDGFEMVRADIQAFGDNVSETSSRKSSLPSIERGRSSALTAAGGALGDFMPLPQPAYDLDIGAPLPDNGDAAILPDFMPPALGVDEAADPFLSAYGADNELNAALTQQQNSSRRHRAAGATTTKMLDKENTTVSGEAVRRWMENRNDIVEAAPRRGPLDQQEIQDRRVLAQDFNKGELWAAVDGSPLARVAGPALTASYIDAVKPLVEKQMEEEAAEREARQQREKNAHVVDENPDEFIIAGDSGDMFMDENFMQSGRKRDREEMEGNDNGESNVGGGASRRQSEAVALATLKHIRNLLSKSQGKGKGKAASGKKSKALPREHCTLHELCEGMARREAARTFVSVLTLASKQLVWAKQAPNDVELGLTNAASEVQLTV